MWVQLHDIQAGFKTEQVCQDLGNFIGKFVESNSKKFLGLWCDYLRIRVTLDVMKPLKRRKKLGRIGGESFWVNFKYEHAPMLCFICGLMGHSDSFCPHLFDIPKEDIVRPYGVWMKVVPRRRNNLIGSQWLRTFEDCLPDVAGTTKGRGALSSQQDHPSNLTPRTSADSFQRTRFDQRVSGNSNLKAVVQESISTDSMEQDIIPFVEQKRK